MKNYAEEIAYLYFRLNGFFLIDNYVSHKSETRTNNYADNDLIGILPIHVKEIVGLKNNNDKYKRLSEIIGVEEKMIGLICEVKGGVNTVTTLNVTKLESCINRIGLLTDNSNVIEKLKTNSTYVEDNVKFIKIYANNSNRNLEGWINIDLNEMIIFIKNRIEKYPEKQKAWNHYGSSLLQYLLYENRNR